MGQYCVKGFHSGGPNQLANKYGPLEQQLPTSMSLDQLIVKECQVRQAVSHHRITNLLSRLTYTELEILMGVFRNRVRFERELSPEAADISLSDLASLLNVSLAKPNVEISMRNKSMWKRLSLRASTVVNLFSSVLSDSLSESWKELSRTFNLDLDASIANQFLSGEQFFQMFLYCDYKSEERLRTPSLVSKEMEIILQDFAVVFAILLHGGTEDLLTLLFIIFSEYPTSSNQVEPSSSSNSVSTSSNKLRSSFLLQRSKSNDVDATLDTRIEAKERKRNVSDAAAVDVSVVDQTATLSVNGDNDTTTAAATNKRPSFFQSFSTSTPPKKVPLSTNVTSDPSAGDGTNDDNNANNINKSRDGHDDSSSTRNALMFPVSEESINNVELIAQNAANKHENGIMLPMPSSHEPITNTSNQDNNNDANSNNNLLAKKVLTEQGIKRILVFVAIMTFKTAKDQRALQHSEALFKVKSALRALSSASSMQGRVTLPVTYLQYLNFFKQLRISNKDQNSVQYQSNPMAKLAFLVTTKDALRNAFRPLLFDLVQNPYKVMRQVVDLYESSREVMEMQQTLDTFLVNNNGVSSNTSSADQVFYMFIIEARWWQIWCQVMELNPIYHSHDSIGHVVIDLIPLESQQAGDNSNGSNSGSGSKKALQTVTKYERFNPFDAAQDEEDLQSLPPLENMFLVEESLPGVFEFLNASRLIPIHAKNTTNSSVWRYVAVPFHVGELLFSTYDAASRDYSANLFKRQMVISNNIVPGEVIASQKLTLPTSINSFVHNFNAQRTISLSLHPFRLPLYWLTSLGLATINPVDILGKFDFANDAMTLGAFMDLIVTRYTAINSVTDGNQSQQYRLWALYDNETIQQYDPRTITEYESPTILPFTYSHQWLLLTPTSTAWTRPCDGVLWSWNPIRSMALSESIPVIKGVMIEGMNNKFEWSSDRIKCNQLLQTIHESTNPLKVGLQVDVLSDYNVWKSGIITHIIHDDTTTTTDTPQITIRTINNNDSNEEYVNVAASSSRVLRAATLTNIDDLLLLPSLLAMSGLEERVVNYIHSSVNGTNSSSSGNNNNNGSTGVASKGYTPHLQSVPEHNNASASSDENNAALDNEVSNNNSSSSSNVNGSTKKNSVVPISIRFSDSSDKLTTLNTTVHTSTASDTPKMMGIDTVGLTHLKALHTKQEFLMLFYTLYTSYADYLSSLRLSQSMEVFRRLGELTTHATQLSLWPIVGNEQGNGTNYSNNNGDGGSIASTVASNSERLTGFINDQAANNNVSGNNVVNGDAIDQHHQAQQSDPAAPSSNKSSTITNPNNDSNNNNNVVTNGKTAQRNGGLNLLQVVKGMVERVKLSSSSATVITGGEDNGSIKRKRTRSAPPTTSGGNSNSLDGNYNNNNGIHSRSNNNSPRMNEASLDISNNNSALTVVTREKFGVVGLNNLGNTCFLSAALQCLLRAPVFIPYFLTYQYTQDINGRSKFGTQGRLTEEFAQFVRTVYKPDLRKQLLHASQHNNRRGIAAGSNNHNNQNSRMNNNNKNNSHNSSSSTYPALSPSTFLKLFQHHKTQFTGADQQDSQEFLSELLDTFHEDLKTIQTAEYINANNGNNSKGVVMRRSTIRMSIDNTATTINDPNGANQTLSGAQLTSDGNKAWEEYIKTNDSIIANTFQGQLCTHVTCETCHKSTTKFEAFTTLSLPIPRTTGASITSTGSVYHTSNDPVRVVVKVFYKMPRILTLLRLKLGNNITTKQWEHIVEKMQQRSQPVRLVLTLPRLANIEHLKQEMLSLLNNNNQVIIKTDDNPIENTAVTTTNPVLTANNITVFDIHREERYRIRKILESKELLHTLVDDGSDDLELLVFENNKDIGFISSLSGSRLSANSNNVSANDSYNKRESFSDEELEHVINGYLDELEYGNNSNNNSKTLLLKPSNNGLLICDLDSKFQSNKGRTFPTNIADFQLYDRVDALDHKNQWYSGSVAQIMLSNNQNDVQIRVHFDSFSSIWDEWFGQTELDKGYLKPVYTNSQRKLKIYDCHVVHRRVVYSYSNNNELKVERIELLECPQMLQMESYRSLSHLHDHLTEQALRCAPNDYYLSLGERSGDSEEWPFKIRQLSVQNPYCVPYLDNDDKNSKDKDKFKQWEGRLFPTLSTNQQKQQEAWLRPVANIYHNKLLITVDWEYISPAPNIRSGPLKPLHAHLHFHSNSGNGGVVSGFVEVNQTCPMVKYTDHVSYTAIMEQLHPSSATIAAANENSNSSSSSNGKAKSSTNKKDDSNSRGGFKDTRPGLTIDYILSRYMASEQIDYFCEDCKELKRGLLVSSIQRVPEVLVLHLKRLVMSGTGGAKIRTLVKFPLKGLDVSSYMTARWGDSPPSPASPDATTDTAAAASSDAEGGNSNANNSMISDPHCVYDLFGVVNHLGGMFGGHYTAYAKCEDLILPDGTQAINTQSLEVLLQEYLTFLPGGLGSSASPAQGQGQGQQQRWFKFDDEFVLELPSQGYANGLPIDATIVSESAYLLFYRKRLPSAENMLRYL